MAKKRRLSKTKRKNLGILILAVLLSVGVTATIGYFSRGFSEWTKEGWAERLIPVTDDEPPVTSEAE